MTVFRYKVILKNGMVADAESRYLSLCTIQSQLNEYQPFITIGDMVFAKNEIVMIEQLVIMEG